MALLTKEEKKILKSIKNKKHRAMVEEKIGLLNLIAETFREIGSPADLVKYTAEARRDIELVDEVNSKYQACQMAREDTVSRAKDIWDLDYADYSAGLYPSGNQIGRRNVMPEDFGRTSWKHRTPPDHKSDKAPFIDSILDEDAFFVFRGLAYKPMEGKSLKGITHPLSGVTLPFIPKNRKWRKIDDYYLHLVDVPAVLSPKSQCQIFIFEDPPGLEFELEIIGDIIGKKYYICKEPWQINVQSALRHQ